MGKVYSLVTKHPIEHHEIVQQNNIAPLRINIVGSLKLMDKYGRLEMAVQYKNSSSQQCDYKTSDPG